MAISRLKKQTMTRQEIVRAHLLRMARRVDRDHGHLQSLADAIEVHPTTISDWINQGYIPHVQCKRLHKRFGKLAPVDELCPLVNRT